MTEYGESPLSRKGILITRPAGQAQNLARLIEAAGGRPVVFPTIEIRDVEDSQRMKQVLRELDRYDYAIFISSNAARFGLNKVRLRGRWPIGLISLAVGEGTASALREAGVTNIVRPEKGADSEALLALPTLQELQGKRVVIFRGVGGRELLAESLRARGATVDYAECYRRGLPTTDPAPVIHAFSKKRIQAVTIGSREGMDNLFILLGEGGCTYLTSTPMFVMHPRIAEHARARAVSEVLLASQGDAGLLDALIAYFSQARFRAH